ncbi:UNVERIFIED_CONTAM: hypothetical protein GTU68_058193 [Idotea baltica]|nr:hypothetical protein [Idotea baltica]
MRCHTRFFWKRKLKQNIPFLIILFIFLILLYYEGFFLWLRKVAVKEENISPTSSALAVAEKKVIFLSSLLKRRGIPEHEFIEEIQPKIYVITPTHARPVQKAELTRLKNVFLLVPFIHWVVVEDAEARTKLVTNFLASSGIPFTHLYKQTPPQWKLKHDEPRWYKPRGVLQRNEGIRWLRENFSPSATGVVYFADDDNTYSVELFNEMRYTQVVSIWPVGLVGGVLVERPSVNTEGKVVGWRVGWRSNRPFAIDMAGFAVNLGFLMRHPEVKFWDKSKRGFIESDFLEQMIKKEDLEPRAKLCTQVLVWHTQTKDPKLTDEERLAAAGRATNVDIEV